jgi:hypothetical protein
VFRDARVRSRSSYRRRFFFVDGRPRAPLGLAFGHATMAIAFLDMLRLAPLLVRVFGFDFANRDSRPGPTAHPQISKRAKNTIQELKLVADGCGDVGDLPIYSTIGADKTMTEMLSVPIMVNNSNAAKSPARMRRAIA